MENPTVKRSSGLSRSADKIPKKRTDPARNTEAKNDRAQSSQFFIQYEKDTDAKRKEEPQRLPPLSLTFHAIKTPFFQ